MNIDELAKEHENDHPGFQLADWYEAAFPSYEVYLKVLVQVERPLPLADQYVLRAIDAGLKDVAEIHGLLGLEYGIVYNILERLHRGSHLTIVPAKQLRKGSDLISITQKGRELLQRLTLLKPEEDDFEFCIDALTGEYFQHKTLWTAKQVKEFHQIYQYNSLPTSSDELEFIKIRRVWRDTQRLLPKSGHERTLLDMLDLENSFPGYRLMRVLQFIRPEDGAVQVQVYDGIERSFKHEAALLMMHKQEIQVLRTEKSREPLDVRDPVLRVIDEDQFEAAKQVGKEKQNLTKTIDERRRQIAEVEEIAKSAQTIEDQEQARRQKHDLEQEIKRLQQRVEQLESEGPVIEVLSMVEHRPKLLQALRESDDRIIIVSPWIKPIAVNAELIDAIAETVGRGVEVWIGYGFGDSDSRERKAVEQLKQIAERKGGHNFRLYRFEDTHAKVVICDDRYMITTSFNWLSFAGRLDLGNRVEIGTLTRDPKVVNAMFERQIKPLFDRGAKVA